MKKLFQLPSDIRILVEQFAEIVESIYPGADVLLFGSFAKGTNTPQSDIDIAVLLPGQYKKEEYRAIFHTICQITRRFDYDIQPQLFSIHEFSQPIGIMEEIARYGIDITAAILHNKCSTC